MKDLIQKMLLDIVACAMCGITLRDHPNGTIVDDQEEIKWCRWKEYTFCNGICRDLYIEARPWEETD